MRFGVLRYPHVKVGQKLTFERYIEDSNKRHLVRPLTTNPKCGKCPVYPPFS